MTTEYIKDGKTYELVPYSKLADVSRFACGGCAFDKAGCFEAPSCSAPPSGRAPFDGQWRAKVEPVLYSSDPDHGDPAIKLEDVHGGVAYKPSHGGYPDDGRVMPLASDSASRTAGLLLSQRQQFNTGLARTADPAPSHKAAASVGGGKLVDLILTMLTAAKDKDTAAWMPESGMTGKELSQHTGRPLNSITPRLAPMRRAGYIHADGTRNRETVWKLGNGVKA